MVEMWVCLAEGIINNTHILYSLQPDEISIYVGIFNFPVADIHYTRWQIVEKNC